jgi:hypothetical protein
MPDLPWLVYAFPLLMVGIVAAAAFYKWLQVRAAKQWPETTGRIVVSGSQVREVEAFDDNTEGGKTKEKRNFANIIYEYEVSRQKFRASRVSIGEDLGNFEVAETIARYPVGKVVTVYYNPRKPREAVLERDPPKGVFGCVIWGVVISVGLILFAFFGFNQLAIFLAGRIHNAPFVVALSTMGLMTLLFGFAMRRQSALATKWPKVTARITESEVDEFQGRIADKGPMTTLYRPQITYTYEFNGVNYQGSQVSLGAKVTSNSDAIARRLVAKYPKGKTFEVHVNPQNASEAVLSPNVAGAWLIWIIAAVLFGFAYYAGVHG